MISTERSYPAPQSLKKAVRYNDDDVKDALSDMFHQKCYLCDGPTFDRFQVEHLRPQSAFPGLRYRWSNLFPAHGDTCNQRRLRWGSRGVRRRGQQLNWPRGGMLSPTQDDIENRLIQWVEIDPWRNNEIRVHFRPTHATDIAAKNTADELEHIHNGDGFQSKAIRSSIYCQYVIVLVVVNQILSSRIDGNIVQYQRKLQLLRKLICRRAPYSAQMRDAVCRSLPKAVRDDVFD